MIRPRQAFRLIHINRVLIRHELDELVLAAGLLKPFSLLLYLAPWHWLRHDRAPRAVRLRLALQDLGPIFVKLGQMLSTRRDLLPADIADELGKLRDQVPPFPGSEARAIIEAAYGQTVETAFASFDEIPLASASIAQVHAASLKDGREVVVKVLRPGIEFTIRNDLDLMYLTARLAERYWPEARRLRPREVIREYEKTILDELDLAREGANAAQLRHNFADSTVLYIPEVEWLLTRRNVMVMERIAGISISDIEALKARGTDMQLLAERGVNIFFTQVFKHNFFHADMHAGNIFVDVRDPADPRYIAVDFGIVGSLSPSDQRYLARNMVAFFNRDYHGVAELHVESGWVPQGTRVQEFESAIRTVCEPIFDRPLKDISFGQLLVRLFQTARRFEMEVQPQLVLLEKTLLNIEGLGRELYPDLDLWRTAKPVLEEWVRKQMGVSSVLKEAKHDFPLMAEMLKNLPELLHDALNQASKGQLSVHFKSPEITEIKHRVVRLERRLFGLATGAVFLLGGSLLLGLGFEPHWLGGGLMLFGGLVLLGGWVRS